MKTVISFADGRKSDITFPDADPVGINDLGWIVIKKNNQVLGTFMPHSLAAILHPDAPTSVTLATMLPASGVMVQG